MPTEHFIAGKDLNGFEMHHRLQEAYDKVHRQYVTGK